MNDYDVRFPMLRLEIQASKMQLVKALDDRNADLQQMVADAMNKAIPTIQAQMDKIMEKAVYEAVSEAMNSAAEKAVAEMEESVVEQLKRKLERELRQRFSKL